MVFKDRITPVEILLVEDDPGDVELTLEVLDKSKIRINLNVVEDGVEAMKFLRKEGDYSNKPTPDLLLLDLNMPKKDGREVLREIKSDLNLRLIPVVVLTTSHSHEDIVKTYTEGCSCYVTKPVGLEEFSKVVQSIDNFWFTVVKYPNKD
jgi:two-component system response regulator